MSNIRIPLPRVRLLFPHLFEKTPIDGKFTKTEKDRRFTASFLLNKKDPKHAEAIANIAEASEKLMRDLKIKKLPNPVLSCCDDELDRIFDGDEVGTAKKAKLAYKAGHYQLQAKSFLHPVLRKERGINLNPHEDENPFYPGCYVNAVIELGTYNNEFGKGISKYLLYVAFVEDGEKLGGAGKEIDGDSYFSHEETDTKDDVDDFDEKELF
jgi:hypothetical protein